MDKTLKKRGPKIEKQVDMVFDTVEALKDQLDDSTIRFKKLIGWNDKTIKNWRKNAEKTIKNFRKNAEETIDNVQDEISSIVKDPTKKVKKTVKTAAKTAKSAAKAVENTVEEVAQADLTTVNGIGPKTAEILKGAGITSIQDLANTTQENIDAIIEKSGNKVRGVQADVWIAEAKNIVA